MRKKANDLAGNVLLIPFILTSGLETSDPIT